MGKVESYNLGLKNKWHLCSSVQAVKGSLQHLTSVWTRFSLPSHRFVPHLIPNERNDAKFASDTEKIQEMDMWLHTNCASLVPWDNCLDSRGTRHPISSNHLYEWQHACKSSTTSFAWSTNGASAPYLVNVIFVCLPFGLRYVCVVARVWDTLQTCGKQGAHTQIQREAESQEFGGVLYWRLSSINEYIYKKNLFWTIVTSFFLRTSFTSFTSTFDFSPRPPSQSLLCTSLACPSLESATRRPRLPEPHYYCLWHLRSCLRHQRYSHSRYSRMGYLPSCYLRLLYLCSL